MAPVENKKSLLTKSVTLNQPKQVKPSQVLIEEKSVNRDQESKSKSHEKQQP